MKKGPRFNLPGSPLDGRPVPQDWARMDSNAKRRALVAYGYASSFTKACSLMGKLGAAVKSGRRAKKDKAAKARHPEGKD
jgi:hypothetical protein